MRILAYDLGNGVTVYVSANNSSQGNQGTSNVSFDIKNPDSFRGANIKEVESYLDNSLKNFTKLPLKRGEGVRYFDGKGNSWQLNYGYENATDLVHSGPYLKVSINGSIIRIPLK